MEINITCRRCDGMGDLPHPLFGLPSCPEPEVTCPVCEGEEVETVELEDFVQDRIESGFSVEEIAKEVGTEHLATIRALWDKSLKEA